MNQPTLAEEAGVKRVGPGGQPVHVYRLALGWAYLLTAGEWRLTKVEAFDRRTVEYAYRIIWVQGRACAVFTVHGQDHWAQPINGNVAPGVSRAEKARAKAQRAEERPPPGVRPLPAPAPPAAPPPPPAAPSKAAAPLPPAAPSKAASPLPPAAPSKAAARLAKMRARALAGG